MQRSAKGTTTTGHNQHTQGNLGRGADSPRLSVRISAEQAARLAAHCRRHKLTRSQAISAALETLLGAARAA